eukprot:gene572-54783_t
MVGWSSALPPPVSCDCVTPPCQRPAVDCAFEWVFICIIFLVDFRLTRGCLPFRRHLCW